MTTAPDSLPSYFTADYIAHVCFQALLTPDHWKATSGREWYESELRTAARQIANEPGSCGLMGGDGVKLGTFRREQAERLWALPADQFGSFICDHRIAIHDAIKLGQPVSAIAVDQYEAQRGRFPREGYSRVGDTYQLATPRDIPTARHDWPGKSAKS